VRTYNDDALQADERLLDEIGELMATVDPIPRHVENLARDVFLRRWMEPPFAAGEESSAANGGWGTGA